MMVKIPIVTPSRDKKVRNLFCLNESLANKKLSRKSLKNIIDYDFSDYKVNYTDFKKIAATLSVPAFNFRL